jgi:hypothetical protein
LGRIAREQGVWSPCSLIDPIFSFDAHPSVVVVDAALHLTPSGAPSESVDGRDDEPRED